MHAKDQLYPQFPTIAEWLKKVDEIKEAEEWVAMCKDRHERFTNIWASWQKYTADPDPVPSSLEVAFLELADYH